MSDTEFIDIGKGLCRTVVRSKAKRKRLERIPGVKVSGTRVIFPKWVSEGIRKIINPPPRKKKQPEPEQIELFPENNKS